MEQISEPIVSRPRLDLLDYFRFGAAVMVLAFHYTFEGIETGTISSIDTPGPLAAVTKCGYLGVELFFLISGFVILNSARHKTASQFAAGRALRLFPAFWVAVLVTAGVIALFGSISDLHVSAPQVLANLTMVPGALGVPSVDGVYWTLLYEVEFYAAVFLVLLAGFGRFLPRLLPWWAFGMLAVSLLAPALTGVPLLGGYFALFAGGALIAEIQHSGPSALRAAGLVASAATSLPFMYRYAQGLEADWRAGLSPAVSVALVAGFYLLMLTMCSTRVSSLRLPRARLAGGLTYPLYLIHANVGFIALSHLATDENRAWVYPLVIAGVLVGAYAIHVLVERRPAAMWRRFFGATVGRPVAMVERVSSGARVGARSG